MMELDYVNRDSRELLKSLHEQVPVPILILYGNTGDIDKREDIRAGPEAATNGVFDMESCIVRAKSFMDIYACLTDNDDRAYILACGQDLVINPAERTVSLRGEHLDLSHKQFDLLFCLASHPGQVLSKEQLFNYLWGEPDVEVDNSIVLYISKLRKKLNKTPNCPEFIQTVRGVGYKFSKI